MLIFLMLGFFLKLLFQDPALSYSSESVMPPSSATRTSRKEHSGVCLGLGQVASPGTGCLEQEPGGGDAFMECCEATPLPQSWNWAPALQHSKSFFSGGAPGSAQASSAVMATAGGWQ